MITEVRTYLAAAAEVITLSETGIAELQAGGLSSSSAQLICQSLKKEARAARGYAKLGGMPVGERNALRALANHADRLRTQALKLR